MTDDLADKLELTLSVGEIIQQSGGHTARGIETMRRMARALGVDHSYVAVSSVNVTMSLTQEGRTLTAMHHAAHFGINFSALTKIKRLVADIEAGQHDLEVIRERIAEIRASKPVYPVWLVMLALGGSTAAFAALFHADATMIGLAFLGGWAGGWTRHLLTSRHMLPFVAVTSAAFVSALIIAGEAQLLHREPNLAPALAASALFLVPGVPMLNGTADELTANYLNGVVRLAMAVVIVLSAAVGLVAAVSLAGAWK